MYLKPDVPTLSNEVTRGKQRDRIVLVRPLLCYSDEDKGSTAKIAVISTMACNLSVF